MNSSLRRMSLAVALVAVCFSFTTAFAQYRTSIQGVVTDSTGALITGATLTLTNPATNEKQVRTSDDAGVFNFNALAAAASFRLEVEKTGFQKKVLDHLQLTPDQANALNVELAIGAESQSITVDATTQPALETETASLNGVVSENQIQHLPSFGRDVIKLSQLAPGIFADGSQDGGGGQYYNQPGTQSSPTPSGGSTGIFATENLTPGFSNGNQAQNNGVSIDGISTTSAVWGGATVITPSEDSVSDVKIVTNSYDAEDGRFTGAQLQITSKTGTNDIHGSLFFTTHQPNLNAFQRSYGGNSTQRDENKFSQFGGSVGGPIWKNKIFAFFNYETVRQPLNTPLGSGWYDTAAFDALATSGSIASTYLTFPGNAVLTRGFSTGNDCGHAGLTEGVNCVTIPGQGINLGTPLTVGLGKQDLGYTDSNHPGCGGAGTGCGTVGSPFGTTADIANYVTVNPFTFTAVQYNGRLDADVTSKDRIGFAIYWVPQSKDNYNGNRGYDIFHHHQINDAFSVIWNHTFSPTLLNELRANAAGWRWNEIKDNPQSPLGLPNDGFLTTGSITVGTFGGNVGSILNQWTYSYKDVATKIIGRQTIKFGGEATRLSNVNACIGCGVPSYGFFNIWDFLNDAPQREGYVTFNPHNGSPTTFRQDNRENILGFFAQDDVKLRRNLTVNIGLRWSYFGPLSDKGGNMYVAHPGAGTNYLTGLTVTKGDSWKAQKNNFSPEIGFAWSPAKFNDKVVFRGGYGLNYNQEELAISGNINSNPGLSIGEYLNSATPTSIDPSIIYGISSNPHSIFGYQANPNFIVNFGSNGLPTSSAASVSIFPSTLPTMRVHHYSFDMQYDVGHNYVASLGYQGSLSRDTFFHQNPLAVPATLGYALNPQINGGDYWGVNGHANYNAMLAELKHQLSHQFMADVQYTWSKSNDTSSAPYSEQFYPYSPNLNYGPSDYNITHAFKAFGMWQPTFFHGSNNWAEKIIGGWSLSGIFNWHTGFPWSPTVNLPGGNLYCGQCGNSSVYPAAYLGGAGTSTSNKAFEGSVSSNYPNGGAAYFSSPVPCSPSQTTNCYVVYTGTASGTALPPVPGVRRNSLRLPGYKDVDLTLTKGFGLPKLPVLGENAKLELRLDAFNVFNNLNLNPNSISNNIGNSNFGTISSALAARVLVVGARFNF